MRQCVAVYVCVCGCVSVPCQVAGAISSARVGTCCSPVGPVPQFCFPDGLFLSRKQCPPTLHTFTLTNEKGKRSFGYCATFYREVPAADLRAAGFTSDGWSITTSDPLGSDAIAVETAVVGVEDGSSCDAGPTPAVTDDAPAGSPPGRTLYAPHCLCLVSPWPFMHLFRAVATDCMEMEDPKHMQAFLVCLFNRLPPSGPQPGMQLEVCLPSGRCVECYNPSEFDLPLVGFPMRCVTCTCVCIRVRMFACACVCPGWVLVATAALFHVSRLLSGRLLRRCDHERWCNWCLVFYWNAVCWFTPNTPPCWLWRARRR